MIESYDKRVAVFLDSAKTLNPEMHIQHEDSMHRKDNIEIIVTSHGYTN